MSTQWDATELEFRRALNAQGTPADVLAGRLASRLLALYLWHRTIRIEGDLGLALVGLLHSLLLEAVALLATRKPALYARHRQLLITALAAHVVWVTHFLVAHGARNIYTLHRGSAALLLSIMLISNAACWLALYMLHARLPMAWSRVALPLLAAYPLVRAGSTCRQLLDAPGAAPLLRTLHRVLTLAHGLVVPVWFPGSEALSDWHVCLTIDSWSVALFGAALPLLGLLLLERQARRAFLARRLLRDPADAAAAAAAAAEVQDGSLLLPVTGMWVLDAVTLSCVLFAICEYFALFSFPQ